MAQFMQHTAAVAKRVSRLIAGITESQNILDARLERGLGMFMGKTRPESRTGESPRGYRLSQSLRATGSNAPNTTLSRPASPWCRPVRTPAVAVF